MDSSGSGKGPI